MLFVIIYLLIGLAIYLIALINDAWAEVRSCFYKKWAFTWYLISMACLFIFAWPIAIITGIIIAKEEGDNPKI